MIMKSAKKPTKLARLPLMERAEFSQSSKYVSCTQVTEQKTDRLVNSTRKILENIYKQVMFNL